MRFRRAPYFGLVWFMLLTACTGEASVTTPVTLSTSTSEVTSTPATQNFATESTAIPGFAEPTTPATVATLSLFNSEKVVPTTESTACKKSEVPILQATTLHHYYGSIGEQTHFGMTLIFSDQRLRGEYFFVDDLVDIPLYGCFEDSQHFTLYAYGEDGSTTAIFHAELLTGDHVEKIVGTQMLPGSDKSESFSITLTSATHGALDNPYTTPGVSDPETFEMAVQAFREAILNDDIERVADFIDYPVGVYIAGEMVNIIDRQILIENYDQIFTEEYKERIREAVPHNMFSNYQGIMLGSHGEVWFWVDGKVIALNNSPRPS